MNLVVVLSGGLDSTVLLYHHIAQGDSVRAISIDYGQRHGIELRYARATCQRLVIPHEIVDLSSLSRVLPGSSQTDKNVPVPEGHYAAETMKATVVANRNMILLSVALGHAVAHKCDGVSYAAHAGDHDCYPDCRPEFVEALNKAAALCDWHPVQIHSPFVKLTKAQIVSVGAALGASFSQTWSCYRGANAADAHCGRCGTCVERRLAFIQAGVADPTDYADPDYALKFVG